MKIPYKDLGNREHGSHLKLFDTFKGNTFIETGTAHGETLLHMIEHSHFKTIKSVELQAHLQHQNKVNSDQLLSRLSLSPEWEKTAVELYVGYSHEALPKMLEDVNEEAVIFLDAHPSGGELSGDNYSEIYNIVPRELDAVLSHRIKSHTLIIDDLNKEFSESIVLDAFNQHELLDDYDFCFTHQVTREFACPWGGASEEDIANWIRKDKLLICIPKNSQ